MTALLTLLDQGDEVQTLTFDYGSKHNNMEGLAADRVLLRARRQYTLCKGETTIVHLGLDKIFRGVSALLSGGKDIPEGHYAEENMKQTVVPNRNMIMLSIAAGLAESLEYDAVAFGNHAGDYTIYPDCRAEFVSAVSKASELGTFRGIHIISPFVLMSKADIAVMGNGLGVPYSLTYSCYKGGPVHCGACGTCIERREAFHIAEVEDLTEYMIPWEESAKIGGLKL
jgi:7-cyano-7-deazaguanine synthase